MTAAESRLRGTSRDRITPPPETVRCHLAKYSVGSPRSPSNDAPKLTNSAYQSDQHAGAMPQPSPQLGLEPMIPPRGGGARRNITRGIRVEAQTPSVRLWFGSCPESAALEQGRLVPNTCCLPPEPRAVSPQLLPGRA